MTSCGLCGRKLQGGYVSQLGGTPFCDDDERDSCHTLVARHAVPLSDGRSWSLESGWRGSYACPTLCDEGCEKDCHESHYPANKQQHSAADCSMTVRLHRNPRFLQALSNSEREMALHRIYGTQPETLDADELRAYLDRLVAKRASGE